MLYSLMFGDPKPGRKSPAAAAAFEELRERLNAFAGAGPPHGERLAADLVHAAGCGTVFTLLAIPEEWRDIRLSAMARVTVLTDGERHVLGEWLDRVTENGDAASA